MNMKSLLKFVPAVAMLFAAGLTASAAISAPVAMSVAPAKLMQKSAVRPLDLQEGETVFTYAPDGTNNFLGVKAAETYDMAILLNSPSLVGAKIVGLRFDMISGTGMTDVKGWLSDELGENPTGEVVNLDSYTKGWNEVRFETPIEITGEDIYAGYSLTVTKVDRETSYPMAIGAEMAAGGFYVKTPSLTGSQWVDISSQYPALSMQVILTDLPSGANIELPDYVIVKPAVASKCDVDVYSNAGSPLTIEYTYSVAGKEGTGIGSNNTVAVMGAVRTIQIDLPAIDEVGEYDLTVKVTKVNGVENTGDNIEATTKLVVTNLDIKHRAVVEEYTGTWCGYCPKGYVAMEYMAEKYPEDFIGLAYHGDDPMEGRNVVMPSSVTGFPAAHLDRASGQIDPYLGAGSTEMGIEQDWLDRCNEPSPAAIEVEAALSDDLETVSVTSRTAFALEGTDGFKVAYALLADGMTGTGRSWQQRNYFGGSSTGLDLDLWDQFLNGGSYVTVEFNDVVILAPDSKGVTGSVPAEITVGEWNEHEYTFTLSDATSAYTASTVSLVQAPWKLRVVAMLLNADGEIVNAAKCNVSTPAGVNGVESSMDEPVEVARYSLDGRLLSEPERGVNLVKMSDGTARKVIVK